MHLGYFGRYDQIIDIDIGDRAVCVVYKAERGGGGIDAPIHEITGGTGPEGGEDPAVEGNWQGNYLLRPPVNPYMHPRSFWRISCMMSPGPLLPFS